MSALSARPRVLRVAVVTATALALAGGSAAAATAAQAHAARPAQAGTTAHVRRACAVTHAAGVMSCMVLIRTDVRQRRGAIGPDVIGFGPADLRSAYKLPSTTAGAGQIIAVVDAYNDPNAVSDFNFYRSNWGLPACNTTTHAGCLTVVNQNGATSPLPANSGSTGWATEESLDVDMAAAICPNCQVYLVEANAPSISDLGTGVASAVSVLGAHFVSNSYGGSESSSELSWDKSWYKHSGVAVTASAGDAGYKVSYPAASKWVTAVGGTSLVKAGNARGWTETVWSGTGSGCSAFEPKPRWQHDTGCTRRTDNDVAAVADPNTGVAIYDTYDQGGWLQVGGTSVSSPIIASVFALAGTPLAATFPDKYPYKHPTQLFDVTSGSNGSCTPAYLCTGEVGYDGPTGLGTPNGTGAFHS